MIAPVLGGYLVDELGFKAATDTIGILSLFVAIIYFCAILLPQMLENQPRFPYDKLHLDNSESSSSGNYNEINEDIWRDEEEKEGFGVNSQKGANKRSYGTLSEEKDLDQP
jgi:hypothetical protein